MNVNRRSAAIGVLATAAVIAGAAGLIGADHIDAPITSADAAIDINDQFVFLSPANSSNVVFAMTMNPLVAPSEAGSVQFPTNVLYEWKIDADGDAVEDLVLQAEFTENDGQQILNIYGPAAPRRTGRESQIVEGEALISGRVSGANETYVIQEGGISAFAGVREDPFYIDLVRLLEVLGGTQTSFRDPGEDTLAGLNTLAIVVEMPISVLGEDQFGVWVTSSRSN